MQMIVVVWLVKLIILFQEAYVFKNHHVLLYQVIVHHKMLTVFVLLVQEIEFFKMDNVYVLQCVIIVLVKMQIVNVQDVMQVIS